MSTSLLGFIGPIGGPEMIMIFVVVLLLFGAKKLPELARGVGKSMGEFKKAREEFERELTVSEEEARRESRKEKGPSEDSSPKVKPAKDNESHDESHHA